MLLQFGLRTLVNEKTHISILEIRFNASFLFLVSFNMKFIFGSFLYVIVTGVASKLKYEVYI